MNKYLSNCFHVSAKTAFLLLLCLCILLIPACSPAPEASKQRSRAVISAGDIVPEEEIRVAEYLQYYQQHFPAPTDGAVGLDLRLGNNVMPSQGCMAWLQIGLQTKSGATEFIAPLNMAIVIDASGSMLDADKMPYLKQSLAIFLRSLNHDDIISIITYSDKATLLLPAQPVGDGYWIQSVIDEIEPGGCTNLHAGLMLGFKQVDKNFNIQRNNRVMLLTDGIANRGVTDPKKIAQDALSYNEKGIFLSTIGLGLKYNDALLMTLADQGKGGYSFIDSAKEMERVFSERAVTQKQCVAQDVVVSVIPDNGVRLIGITGFDGAPPSEGASITLWPLSIENSTVVLAQLQVGPGNTGPRGIARVRLDYFDTLARQTATVEKVISGEMSSNLSGYAPTWDLEILRNVTIQNTAQGMRTISQMFDSGQYEAAWRIAVDLERQLMEAARLTGDQQLYDDAALMRRYQETLSDAVWHTEYREPYLEDAEATNYESERPYRGGKDNPDLPEVDIK